MKLRFIVRKDSRNNRWGVYDTHNNEWNVWPSTKKQALETAEDWNLAEELSVKNRRASMYLIVGGAA